MAVGLTKPPSILLATRNQGKLAELRKILADWSGEIIDLRQAAQELSSPDLATLEIPETGDSFAANAELKARGYAKSSGLPTLAEDSGLEVMALGNRPGVYSARFAPGTDHDRNLALLAALADSENRTARFVTVACFYDPATDQINFFSGQVTGTISFIERGQAGFGYDPLFIPDGYQQTMAELGIEIKNKISHRAQALAKFRQFLLVKDR